MEDDNVDHDGVKGEEDNDVENNNVEEEEGDDDVEDDDVEEEDRSQDRDPQFVRACAVEMHMDMLHEPFYARILKNLCPRLGSRFVRARAVEMHMDKTQESVFCGNLQGKRRAPE